MDLFGKLNMFVLLVNDTLPNSAHELNDDVHPFLRKSTDNIEICMLL